MCFFVLIILNLIIDIILIFLIVRLNFKIKAIRYKIIENHKTSINISNIMRKELKMKNDLLENFTSLINQYFN